MGKFLSRPKLSPLDDGVHWELLEPFTYITDAGQAITVPTGRLTNFASVPRPFWNIYPPWGKYGFAAIIHDELYAEHREGSNKYTRAQADLILLEAMRAKGVSEHDARVIYDAVRVGGAFAWEGDHHK